MYYYTVRQGDTLYSIAQYFGVPLSSIYEVNPGIDPYSLYAGQVILIPVVGYRPFPRYPFYGRPARPPAPRPARHW